MTQGARGGQGTPLTTVYDSDGAGKTASNQPGSAAGTPNGAPSPTNPTTSTPWGSTSTAQGSGYGAGAGAPAWSSTPLGGTYTDAPAGGLPGAPTAPGGAGPRTATAPPPPPRNAPA